ncbi:SdiA-regulated domain-containing protein [Myroides odoratus]|uniref:SdiA-regulated domain-containing protein n=1 Tax=Myroides odoratus TaxID=256 RepID=UPI0039AF07A6
MGKINNSFNISLLLFFTFIQSSRAQVALEDSFSIHPDEISRYPTKIKGFSGLIFDETQKNFYAVSDYGKIYKIDSEGNILENIYKKGGDLEGITLDPSTLDVYVVDEARMKVFKHNKEEKKLASYLKIKIPNLKRNKGLEAIAFGRDTLYIGNQFAPKRLFKYAINTHTLTYFDLDYPGYLSDLFYDDTDQTLWIANSKGKKIYQFTLEGKLIYEQKIPFVQKAEALVVDRKNKIVWIGCDETGILHKVKLKK